MTISAHAFSWLQNEFASFWLVSVRMWELLASSWVQMCGPRRGNNVKHETRFKCAAHTNKLGSGAGTLNLCRCRHIHASTCKLLTSSLWRVPPSIILYLSYVDVIVCVYLSFVGRIFWTNHLNAIIYWWCAEWLKVISPWSDFILKAFPFFNYMRLSQVIYSDLFVEDLGWWGLAIFWDKCT